MQQLSEVIRKVLPAVIKEVNEVRIPALESAWGRSFKEELANEDQVTVEISKNYNRVLNNTLFRHVSAILKDFREHTTNGSDYVLGDVLIEDKNSFSDSGGWVGNGFDKTPVHLLKKFKCDDNGRIREAFICIVDLSKCSSQWSDRSINTNRSVISFDKEDRSNIHVVYGEMKVNRVKLKPIMKKI